MVANRSAMGFAAGPFGFRSVGWLGAGNRGPRAAQHQIIIRIFGWIGHPSPEGRSHRRRLSPPSTWSTSPVENGKAPTARAATARPTSSGVPQRRIGESPSAIRSVVGVVDRGGHVGLDNPRPDLVDSDAVLGQPDGEELGHHAQPRLRHAVFPAVRCWRTCWRSR